MPQGFSRFHVWCKMHHTHLKTKGTHLPVEFCCHHFQYQTFIGVFDGCYITSQSRPRFLGVVGLIQYDFWTTRRGAAEALALVVRLLGEAPNFFVSKSFRKDEDLINLINPFQIDIRNLSTYEWHISPLEQIFDSMSPKPKVVVVLVVNHDVVQRWNYIVGKSASKQPEGAILEVMCGRFQGKLSRFP